MTDLAPCLGGDKGELPVDIQAKLRALRAADKIRDGSYSVNFEPYLIRVPDGYAVRYEPTGLADVVIELQAVELNHPQLRKALAAFLDVLFE